MGVRGEIFSNKVILPNRTYFFNVKENRMGDLYLNIVESKNRDSGGFERQSVILFADDLQEFLKGFDESLKVLEKAMREKRHSGGVSAKREEGRKGGNERGDGNERGERKRPNAFGEKNARGRGNERKGGSERGGGVSARREEGRRGGNERGERKRPNSFDEKNTRGRGNERRGGNERGERSRQNSTENKNFRSRDNERRPDRGPRENRRVVVKRRD